MNINIINISDTLYNISNEQFDLKKNVFSKFCESIIKNNKIKLLEIIVKNRPAIFCNIYYILVIKKYNDDVKIYDNMLNYLSCQTLEKLYYHINNDDIDYLGVYLNYNNHYEIGYKLVNIIKIKLLCRKHMIYKYLNYNINEKYIIDIIMDKYYY